jgi:hypothetical protein
MNCYELETLLCDYVDGTLRPEQKAEVEGHLAECPGCAQMARDAAAVAALASRAAAVEPPPELVTRILYELAAHREKVLEKRRGPLAALGQWLGPVLQPRFAMGMAMTVLSLAMLARAAHIDVRQLSLADLDPVRVWQGVDDRFHRGWTRAVKFYESLRFVYEIRSRLAELTAQEEGPPDSGSEAPAGSAGGNQEAPRPAGKK